jgi:hypothetical protein
MMKTKLIATTALLALGASAQAQLSGPNRPGIGTSPGTFQSQSSSVGTSTGTTTGTGLSGGDSSSTGAGRTTEPLGTFGNTARDGIHSTLPDVTPSLPNITPPLSDTTTGSQIENPAGVFRSTPMPSTGVTPRTGVGSADATRGAVDPFATPTIRRSDDLNGVGGAASGEIGNDRGRLTPPPDVRPSPRPLGDDSTSAAILGNPNLQRVNADTSDFDRSSLSGGPQAPKVGSDLNTSGVRATPRTQQQPLDQALSAKIRAQLSQTPVGGKPVIRLNGDTVRDMRITSQNGRVVLEGNVNSQQERDLIELRAREVQGVAAIDNRLKVRNQNVGAPAASESGTSQQSQQDRTSGQSKQNSSDLHEEHFDVIPDR